MRSIVSSLSCSHVDNILEDLACRFVVLESGLCMVIVFTCIFIFSRYEYMDFQIHFDVSLRTSTSENKKHDIHDKKPK